MATKKASKKTAKKPAKKAAKKASKKVSKKSAKKPAKKAAKKVARKPAKKAAKKAGGAKKPGAANNQLRVRMYRIGFGDFFLITVPTKSGPEHILIDCGVHAGDIKSMAACVQDLAKETNRKLALVIATHYHADHLSGFATQFDEFAQFDVDMVWITNRLDPKHKEAAKFKAQITKLAGDLQLRLGARKDPAAREAMFKINDALGVKAKKEGGNEKALRLLTEGFKNTPPVKYYQGGQEPELPKSLKGAITAELLGPAPMDSGKEFATADNKNAQYIMRAADNGLPPATDKFVPFERDWPGSVADYPTWAFSVYRTKEMIEAKKPGTSKIMEKILQDAQPDILLAMADAVDGTLNNQSLVVLFTCQGKKLLFVGDAQWGNWSYWLYGKKSTGKDLPAINKKAKDILASIDFYKVGHHGSSNANPIPAVAALNPDCVSMCSTEVGDEDTKDPQKNRPYGDIKKGTEVPRILLMEEMEKRTKNQLVRSDFIPIITGVKASFEATSQLKKLPKNFSKGDLYVDYIFPK
jgi:beta-lactamase superfamily II metal-dependent hydrolase